MIREDSSCSICQRMRFAGQSNPSTFFQSYMSQLSTVDGQGSYFGTGLRRDHLEDFRGLSLHRHPQLWQSLPAKHQFELERRPDFIALDEEIETLNRKIQNLAYTEDTQPLHARRRDLYERRRQLTVEELRECRKLQPRQLPTQAASETCLEDHRQTLFAHVRGLLPEQARLASSLFQPVELRSANGRRALQDLIALCKQDSRVVHRPALRLKDGRCPSPECSIEMKRSVALPIPVYVSAYESWLTFRQHLGHHYLAASISVLPEASGIQTWLRAAMLTVRYVDHQLDQIGATLSKSPRSA